jgi:hypothetical protein
MLLVCLEIVTIVLYKVRRNEKFNSPGGQSAPSSRCSAKDRIGILLDFNKKKAFYFKNGTFLKVTASIYQGNTYFPSVHIYYPKDKVTISMKEEKDFPKGDFY